MLCHRKSRKYRLGQRNIRKRFNNLVCSNEKSSWYTQDHNEGYGKMGKTIACIIARTNSSRLPKKVLRVLNGRMLIEHIIDRMKLATNIDEIYVCTSTHPDDEVLLNVARKNGVKGFAGSENFVISRLLGAVDESKADNIIRITCDNIFTDPFFIERMIDEHENACADYTRTEYLPRGVTAEVIRVSALKKCLSLIDPGKSQYLTIYIFDPEIYNCLVLLPPKRFVIPLWNLGVDTLEDFERTEFIFKHLQNNDMILLDEIFSLHKDISIPFIEMDMSTMIKLPDKKELPIETYNEIYLINKLVDAKTVQIEADYYEKRKNKEYRKG